MSAGIDETMHYCAEEDEWREEDDRELDRQSAQIRYEAEVRRRRSPHPEQGGSTLPTYSKRIGVDVHSAACVDDDGKVECVCGLDEIEYHESNREPASTPPGGDE